jgi:hypothetical protein
MNILHDPMMPLTFLAVAIVMIFIIAGTYP